MLHEFYKSGLLAYKQTLQSVKMPVQTAMKEGHSSQNTGSVLPARVGYWTLCFLGHSLNDANTTKYQFTLS